MSEAVGAKPFRQPPVVVVFVCLLVLWEIGVRIFKPAELILPAPSAVFAELAAEPMMYLTNAWYTLMNTLVGFGLSVVIGVALTRVFAALLILAVIGTVLFYALEAVERAALPWHVSRRVVQGGGN
jgi:NitT/TauT family transport system permease protein